VRAPLHSTKEKERGENWWENRKHFEWIFSGPIVEVDFEQIDTGYEKNMIIRQIIIDK